jgi:hypothetical protein
MIAVLPIHAITATPAAVRTITPRNAQKTPMALNFRDKVCQSGSVELYNGQDFTIHCDTQIIGWQTPACHGGARVETKDVRGGLKVWVVGPPDSFCIIKWNGGRSTS